MISGGLVIIHSNLLNIKRINASIPYFIRNKLVKFRKFPFLDLFLFLVTWEKL